MGAIFIIAFTLGILGSFHCVGMCGPIALALPTGKRKGLEKLAALLAYTAGRVLTYSVLGLMFGLIGRSFALFGLQQILSIALGLLVLGTVFLSLRPAKLNSAFFFHFQKLKNKMLVLFEKHSLSSFFTIGLLNGLLPCGLVYLAAAGATGTTGVFSGLLFMASFGLGTFPAMFFLSWFGHTINSTLKARMRTAFPYMITFMAILMIVRGMNLGIPYVSPKMNAAGEPACCHQSLKQCCHK